MPWAPSAGCHPQRRGLYGGRSCRGQPALAERINHEAVSLLARGQCQGGTAGAISPPTMCLTAPAVDPGAGGCAIPAQCLRGQQAGRRAGHPGPVSPASNCANQLALWRGGGTLRACHSAPCQRGPALEVVADQWGADAGGLAGNVRSPGAATGREGARQGRPLSSLPAGETSWHGFASALVEEGCRLGLLVQPVPIKPIPSANWPQAARRPLNSRLDCRRFTTAFGIPIPPGRC